MKNQSDTNILEQIEVNQLISMFDLLPGVLFWIKDTQHNFIHANQAFVEHKKAKGLAQILGKNDYDFSPTHIANQFTRDDDKILAGQSVTERLEVNMTQTGETAWYATSKRPLKNRHGNIIGSYGITRHLQEEAMALPSVDAIKTPVNFVRENYQRQLTVEELADIAHLSVSALERRFKKYLAKTPKQFINEVRLENARRLLIETSISISQVGHDTGFSDHSYFSKQFRLFFNELPSQTRQKYRDNE